jgi:hypothetical protein
MVGRWPHLTPRFLEGAALWYPPFAGVVHGVRTLHPRAICRSRPPSVRAIRSEHLRSGLALRGLVGAIGWSSASPPVRRGCRRGRVLSSAPSLYLNSRLPFAGGVGPSRRSGASAPASGRTR